MNLQTMLNNLDSMTKELVESKSVFTRAKLGETKYSESSMSDKWVQDTIKLYGGKDASKLEAAVKAEVKKREDHLDKAPFMTETMRKNVVENVMFDTVFKVDTSKELFDTVTAMKLFRQVRTQRRDFFPATNHFQEGKIISPEFIVVPTTLDSWKKYNNIDTAACTPDCVLIFNELFVEKIMQWFEYKGLQARPNDNKYISNGGSIPDYYEPLEFLILHEIMHFVNADHFYSKSLGLNPTISNWLGDFIINHNLVKAGYSQLPMGLFCDNINFDQQANYKKMYDMVKEEFDKLNPQQQKDLEDQMNDQMDDHEGNDDTPPNDGGEKGEPQDGKGEPQDGDGEEGEEGEEGKDGKPGKGKGKGKPSDKKSDEKGSGSGDGESSDEKSDEGEGSGDGDGADEGQESSAKGEKADALEKEMAKRDEAMKNSGDKMEDSNAKEAKAADKNKEGKSQVQATVSGGRTASSANGMAGTYQAVLAEPTYKWDTLLRRMLSDSSTQTDESYNKISGKSISRIVQAQSTGAGAVKPGEVTFDENRKKLVFIIDTSGSVISEVKKFYNEIENMVKKNTKNLAQHMIVIKFASSVHGCAVIDLKKMKWSAIAKDDVLKLKTLKSLNFTNPFKSMFERDESGGTNFTNELVQMITHLYAQNANIVIFSDSDISSDSKNIAEVKRVLKLDKTGKRVALIASDKTSFRDYINKFGDFKNITCLE